MATLARPSPLTCQAGETARCGEATLHDASDYGALHCVACELSYNCPARSTVPTGASVTAESAV